MKIVHKKRIFIIFIFVLTLSLSGIFIYNHFNVDIDKVLESEEYSYLPDEAKEYVKDAFEATGEVIPTEKNKKENQVYLNPSYIKYLQLSSAEKKNVSNIPDPYTIDYDFRKIDKDLILPSSYDMRNHNGKNFVGPMKNQSTTGLCWAFTAGEQVESLLLKNSNSEYVEGQSQLFSVRQFDYATSTNGIYRYDNINGYRGLGSGGNFLMVGVALSNGIALADDSVLPFDTSYPARLLEDIIGYESKSIYEANTTVSIPSFNFDSDYTSEDFNYYIDIVKSYVYSYGGAYVGTESPQGTCGSFNIDGKAIIRVDDNCVENSGHAMHVIGWDDNYTYQYCKTGSGHSSSIASCPSSNLVTGKGAWLLKNSWGTDTDPGYQYLYLAYDSLNSTFGITTEIEKLSERNWDNNYHDNYYNSGNGYVVTNDYENHTKQFSGNEKLEKVKFLSYAVAGTYRLNVIVGTEVYSNIMTVSADFPGIHTFDLSDKNIVIDSDNFKVQVIGSNSSSTLVSGTISTFTSNVDDKVESKTGDVVIDKIYSNDAGSHYEFTLLSKTRNIKSNEYVSYKLFKGSEDITLDNMLILNDDDFEDDDVRNRVANNEILSIIYINRAVEAGTYTLKMYYKNKEIGSSSITLNGIINVIGTGTSNDPYIISSEEELEMIRDRIDCSGSSCELYYKLGDDITLTKPWNPIGTSAIPFKGGLDGDGHKIIGLNVNGAVSGLFAYASKATIKNITFENPTIIGSSHSGVVSGFALDLQLSNINIIGGSVKSIGGSAGNLVGRYEMSNISPVVDSIYNSSIVSGYISSGLIGTLANSSAYSSLPCYITLSNILNVGNVNLRGTDGDASTSSLLLGEVKNSRPHMNNIIVTGQVLDDELISYYGLIGTYNKNTCITNSNISNIYYVNGTEAFSNGTSLGLGTKKSITDLVKNSSYSGWSDFSKKWKYNSYEGISRLPSPINSTYQFTDVDEIVIGMDKGGNLLDFITPDLNAANNIIVSSIDDSYLTIDAGFNIKGVKTGKTKINITSYYDGFSKDVDVTIVNKANPVITYNSNDSRNLSEKETVNLNDKINLKTNLFAKEGFVLVEWNTKSDGTGVKYSDGQEIEGLLDDLTLYAIWKEVTYKVIYNYNGEFDNVEVTLKYSDEVDVYKNTHSRENYTFKEWNTKSDGTGKGYTGKISKLTTKDGDVINLYAIWKLNLSVGSKEYKVDESNKIIDMIGDKTTVEEFKKKFEVSDGFDVKVDVTSDNLIYTGGKTKIYDGDKLILEFVNVIRGDINGDGKISALDYVKVKNHIMKTNVIDDKTIYFKAADANNDNGISALDYVRIKNIIMKGAN